MQQLDVAACGDLLARGATLVGPPAERAPGGGVGERSVTSRDATFARALAHIERRSPAHVKLVKQLAPFAPPPPLPPPSPRTKWTRRVPHPVLIGHTASLTPH
jgi:hypothetical protein